MVLARESFVTLLSKRNVQIGFAEKNLNGSVPTSDFEIFSRAITIARNVAVNVTIGGFNNGTVSLNNQKLLVNEIQWSNSSPEELLYLPGLYKTRGDS